MKIKFDFVTNSSSTCFVLISEGDFNFKKFMNSVGVEDKSIFSDIYKNLFNALKDNLEPVRQFVGGDRWNKSGDFNKFIIEIFSQETLEKIIEAEKAGKVVYAGRLHSDNDSIECFFCTDAFIIDTEDLFIDATNDGW